MYMQCLNLDEASRLSKTRCRCCRLSEVDSGSKEDGSALNMVTRCSLLAGSVMMEEYLTRSCHSSVKLGDKEVGGLDTLCAISTAILRKVLQQL